MWSSNGLSNKSSGNWEIWTVILVIVIIIILFLIVCWGICQRMCPKEHFYTVGSVWHGPGYYNVSNINTSDEQNQKCEPDRVDGILKLTCVKNGIVKATFKWKTIDCNYNVTAQGEKQLQGAVNQLGVVDFTEIGRPGIAKLTPSRLNNLIFTYNELSTSQFNGKVTMRINLERGDDCIQTW